MRATGARAARALLAVVAIGLGVLALGAGACDGSAQTPALPGPARPTATPARTPTDAEILAVERQLLCPLCVNERLDVCTLAICGDMKQIIRERLAAGATPDDIILFFETRYGPKVRAELPRAGFNLVLFGWVGAAIALTGTIGGYALVRLRRDSRRRFARSAAPTQAPDDRWVDRLVDEASSDEPPGAR